MRLQFYVATFALHLALSMGFGPTAWTMPKSLVFSAKCDGIRCGVREKREWESVDYRRLGRFPQGQRKRPSRAMTASTDTTADGGGDRIPNEGSGSRLGREAANNGIRTGDDDQDTYYRALGLVVGASPAEIKEAYRRLAMKLHPDSDGDGSSREEFEKITAAYEVLSDPGKRSTYDQGLAIRRFVDKVKAGNWGKTLRAVAGLGAVVTSVGISAGAAAAEPVAKDLARGIDGLAAKGPQPNPTSSPETDSSRREQQAVRKAKAEAERKVESLRRRTKEMLTEVVALEEMTAARLKEQGEWNATLAERQQVVQTAQGALVDVESQVAVAGEVLRERRTNEQEATEALRKAKAAREAFEQVFTTAQRRVSSAEATVAAAERRLAEAQKALDASRDVLRSATQQVAETESQRSKAFREQDSAQEALEKAKNLSVSGRVALSDCRDREAGIQAHLRERAKQERAAAVRVKELGNQAETARSRALRLKSHAEETAAAAAVVADTVESYSRREAQLVAEAAAARAAKEAAFAAAQEEEMRQKRKEAAAVAQVAVSRAKALEEAEAEAVEAARVAMEAALRATEDALAVGAEVGSGGREKVDDGLTQLGADGITLSGTGTGLTPGEGSGSGVTVGQGVKVGGTEAVNVAKPVEAGEV
ncbi:unnamed protein product [Ascophyllum nodosum]